MAVDAFLKTLCTAKNPHIINSKNAELHPISALADRCGHVHKCGNIVYYGLNSIIDLVKMHLDSSFDQPILEINGESKNHTII